MSRGIIYPPYDVAKSMPTSLGTVGAAYQATAIAPIASEGPYFDGWAERYWAALTSVAGYRARHAAAPPPAPEAATPTTIDQHDTLRLHRSARVENPFHSLLEHQLHVHLEE